MKKQYSDFDSFLDSNDRLFTRSQYHDMQRRLKFIQGKSDRMKRLSSRDEEEIRSIEHILNEYESGFQEWKRRRL
jgi:hypothetical protein